MSRSVAVLIVMLAALCTVQALSLTSSRDDSQQMEAAGKRNGRRITRDRYRMGYMFGKRSNLPDAGLLIKALTRKAIPVKELALALHSHQDFAQGVARHLDRNGDGYVSVRELE